MDSNLNKDFENNINEENTEETLENTVNEENTEISEEDEIVEAEKTEAEEEKTEEETLEAKLIKAEEQVKEAQDKWLRQLAEFENFRKRTNQEKQGMYNNGVRDTVEKFLPVIDNFERAVAATEDKKSSTYKGIEMILKQMLEVMSALGVEEIPAEGEPFDPNIHSAVMHIEDESCDENVVVEVFQKGYRHGDKVIRPAMVKVAN